MFMTARTWSSSPSPGAARALPRSRTESWNSCGARRSSCRRARTSACSTKSTSSPACPGGSFHRAGLWLYGDKLFADYEQRFLKRNVQGEIIARAFNPLNWAKLVIDGLGSLRTGGRAVRRNPVQRRHFRRSRPRRGPADPGGGDGHSTGSRFVFSQRIFDVICSDLNARAAVPRRCGLVGRAGGALVRHDQQLWRYLQQDHTPLGGAVHRDRRTAATGGAGDTLAPRQRKRSATASIGPISISSTAACRTTWACAACSMRWKFSRRCMRPVCPRRSTARSRIIVFIVNSHVFAADELGRVGERSRAVDILLKSAGHADRRIFLRDGRSAERHGGAVANRAADPRTRRHSRTTRILRLPPRCASRTPRSMPSTSRSPRWTREMNSII